jgi:hypothetical protein
MKTVEVVRKPITTYVSDVVPEVVGVGEMAASTIAWADANPVVWKIVMGTRSKVFGKNASAYMGYERGDSSTAVLARVSYLKDVTSAPDTTSPHETLGALQRCRVIPNIFVWRARFTIQHYTDKGFKGGLFQQFDGTYDRGSMYLDYTPKLLDEVVKHFLEWCDLGYKFPTAAVKLDKNVIKTFKVAP